MTKQIEVFSVTDDLAKAIKQVSTAAQAIQKAGIKEEAIVILVQEMLGRRNITQQDIRRVLYALRTLEVNYLVEAPKS